MEIASLSLIAGGFVLYSTNLLRAVYFLQIIICPPSFETRRIVSPSNVSIPNRWAAERLRKSRFLIGWPLIVLEQLMASHAPKISEINGLSIEEKLFFVEKVRYLTVFLFDEDLSLFSSDWSVILETRICWNKRQLSGYVNDCLAMVNIVSTER